MQEVTFRKYSLNEEVDRNRRRKSKTQCFLQENEHENVSYA